MVSSSAIALLTLASASVAWPWDGSGQQDHKPNTTCDGGEPLISYTSVAGFFKQDDPATDPETFDYTEENFGLITRPYPTDGEFDPNSNKTLWQRFEYYVNRLNQDAGEDTQYKVLFMGRHGEGFHNAAEDYYGTTAWNCYWGPRDGNGTVVWRDADLTAPGRAQAAKAADFWAQQLATAKQPAPQAYYTSPLTRCATTANLTFGGLVPGFAPTIKERLREGISVRTCDARSSRAAIAARFPGWRFEDGFTEEDELWRGDEGETTDAQLVRAKAVVDDIFGGGGDSNGDNATWVSITSHSGQIAAMLRALGHREFRLATGQAIAILVQAETTHHGGNSPPATTATTAATSTAPAWTVEPTCSAPPVTSRRDVGCVCSTTSSALVAASVTATPSSDSGLGRKATP